MVETFIAGLAVAALSGLSFVAYRHPNGYMEMYPRLTMVPFVGIVGVALFLIGAGSTYVQVAEELLGPPEELLGPPSVDEPLPEPARAVLRDMASDWLLWRNYLRWGAVVWVAWFLYLTFLTTLPSLGIQAKKGE